MIEIHRGLQDVNLNRGGLYILFLEDKDFNLRDTGIGSQILHDRGRDLAFKPPHLRDHQVSRFLSSFFMLVNSMTETNDYGIYRFSILL